MKNAIHFPNRHESSRLLLAAILQHAESTITLIVNRSMRIFLFVAWIVATSAYAGYHPCAAVRYANQYAQTPNQFYGSVPDPCLNPGRFVGDAANFMSQVLAAGCRIPCTDDNPPDHQGVEGCPDCQQSAAFTENGCLDPPAETEHPSDPDYDHSVIWYYQDFHNELIGREAAERITGPMGFGPNHDYFRCPTQLEQCDPISIGDIVIFYFEPTNDIPDNADVCNIAIVTSITASDEIATITARDKYRLDEDDDPLTNYMSDANFASYFDEFGYSCTYNPSNRPNDSDFWTHFKILHIIVSDSKEIHFDEVGSQSGK